MCGFVGKIFLINIHGVVFVYIFVENIPHVMDDFTREMRRVVDSATKSTLDINEITSIRQLYDERKNRLKLSDRQIQNLLGMDKKTLIPIINGEGKQINIINVIKLAHFLCVSVNDLVKILVPEMDCKQIGEMQRAREAGYIVELFDVSTLTKMKFFKSDQNSSILSERIKRFFGLDNLYDYSEKSIFSVFSRTNNDSNSSMRSFWVRSALVQFHEIANPNPYDREALLDLIPRIRPYTRDVSNGLTVVVKALYQVGVTVIFQPSLEKLQVRGATMMCNQKPCIVLSDYKKYYPTLWFVLLHELHHVLFDLDEIMKRTYHLSSGEGDLFLMDEDKSDDFAVSYLLNESRQKYAQGYLRSNFYIEKISKEWGIHPSFVYVMHCFKTNEWAYYSKYIPKMDQALHLLNTHPFDRDTLVESAIEIKNKIFNNHE